jgi:hypothetical protein
MLTRWAAASFMRASIILPTMQASYDDGITKPPRYDRWPIVSTSQMYFPVGWPHGAPVLFLTPECRRP